jgi:hypothetical protein
VKRIATDLGVSWHAVMTQIRQRGAPVIDDPSRLNEVGALGVDETACLRHALPCANWPIIAQELRALADNRART